MHNLIDGGFKGDIYPVNPNYSYIMDIPATDSISQIKTAVDLVVVTTPIEQGSGNNRILRPCRGGRCRYRF